MLNLETKLSWKQHVEAKCKKALALICQLCRVTGVTWELLPKLCFGYTPPSSDLILAMQQWSGGLELTLKWLTINLCIYSGLLVCI